MLILVELHSWSQINPCRTAAPPRDVTPLSAIRLEMLALNSSLHVRNTASSTICKYRNAAAMNNALRLVRTSPSRTASSTSQWACFFCQHTRPQSRNPNFADVRRHLSISRPRLEPQTPPRQQANAAYMENIRAQYNQKNKTSTYGDPLKAGNSCGGD